MTHFLKQNERHEQSLTKPRAGLTLRFSKSGKKRKLFSTGDTSAIGVAKMGSRFAPVPDDVEVWLGPPEAPKLYKPQYRLWVSLDSIDPFHFLIDVAEL